MMPAIRRSTRVQELIKLCEFGYELRLEKEEYTFQAGQTVVLHGPTQRADRSYTVASGENDPFISVLFRLIPEGKLTPLLVELSPGDPMDFTGPCGEFVVEHPEDPLVFIGTGTGLAPARSYLRSLPDLNLTVLHGVRKAEELYFRDEFANGCTYYPCVSREEGVGFHGRVTDLLPTIELPENARYHLCGSTEMIFEVMDWLEAQGVPEDRMHTEAYFRHLSM